MQLQCDSCENIIDLTSVQLGKFESLPNDVERYYMECPNCKEQYTTHYENKLIKAIRFKIKLIQQSNSIEKGKDIEKLGNLLFDEQDKLMKEFKINNH